MIARQHDASAAVELLRQSLDLTIHFTERVSNIGMFDTMMVGDGTPAFVFPRDSDQPYIQLFKRDGDRYIGPRILAFHRSTFNDQHAHCHPRFTPDGKSVLYTSDLTSYSNMYLVDVGDFEDLPEMS